MYACDGFYFVFFYFRSRPMLVSKTARQTVTQRACTPMYRIRTAARRGGALAVQWSIPFRGGELQLQYRCIRNIRHPEWTAGRRSRIVEKPLYTVCVNACAYVIYNIYINT